jgi:hypothetical protein
MSKELPKMYQIKINKPINSIQKMYSTMNENKESVRDSSLYSNISIEKKIDNIFNAYDYVYKADVTIVTDNDTMYKRIVARNKNNLITIDNEFIPINIIRDIYK